MAPLRLAIASVNADLPSNRNRMEQGLPNPKPKTEVTIMNPMFQTHKIKFTVGGVLLASILVFGFQGTMHRFTAGLDEAREIFNDSASVDHLVKIGRKQINEAENRLLDAESAAKSYHQQEARLRAEVAHLRQASSVARTRLETLRPALSSKTGIQAAGCQYTAADVRQDAVQLATFVKGCDEQAGIKEQELKDLQQTLTNGDAVMSDARREFAQAQSRFRELEVRLKQQQAVAEASAAARAAREGVSAELGGAFAETMGALEKRLNRLQRQNETLRAGTGGVPAGTIPLGLGAGVDAETLVTEVLGNSTAQSAASTTQVN